MRITQLESQLLRLPLTRPITPPHEREPGGRLDHLFLLVVHIDTDAGHRGLGFAYSLQGGGRALKAIADDDLAPLMIGEDPLDHERLAIKVYWRLADRSAGGAWWRRRTRPWTSPSGTSRARRRDYRSTSCSAAPASRRRSTPPTPAGCG